MNRLRSGALYLFVAILFVALTGAVAGWSLLTESGSRFALDRMQNSLSNVEYDYTAGNLATGLSLKNVRWKLKNNTTVTSDELTLTWDPWCWRGRMICIKQAAVDELSINLVRPRIIRNPIIPKPISLPVRLTAKLLVVKKLIINRPDRPPIAINNLEFTGKFNGTTIEADSLIAEWQQVSAAISGEMRLEENYPLHANGKISINANGRQTAAASIALHGDLLTTYVNLNSQQPFYSNVTGTVSLLNRRIPLDLSARWQNSEIPFGSDNPVFSFHEGEVNLSGFRPDYRLIGSASLRSRDMPEAQVTLDSRVNTRKLTIDKLNLVGLDGEVDVSGDIEFRDAVHWKTEVRLTEIFPSRHWTMPDTSLSGSLSFNGEKKSDATHLEFLAMDISGQSGNHPFSVTGDATTDTLNNWMFDNIEIQSSRNHVKTSGTLSESSDLTLNFALREPGMFNPEIKGDIFGNFNVTGPRTSPDINGNLRSRQLLYKNWRAKNTRLKADISAAGTQPGSLNLTTETMDWSQTTLDNINLLIKGTRNNHTISAGFNNQAINLEKTLLNGSVDENVNWYGKLLSVTGDIEQHPFNLVNAFELTWIRDKKSLAIEPSCWSVSDTYACIDKPALLGKDGTVSFSLKGLKLDAINPFMPENVKASGLLHSTGEVHWSKFGKPMARVSAHVEEGAISASPPLATRPIDMVLESAELNISTTDHNIESTLKVVTDKLGDIEATASIDTKNRHYPINGRLQLGKTDLATLQRYYPQVGVSDGFVTGMLATSGPLKQPKISGKLKLRETSYSTDALPLPLDQINIDIDITDTGAALHGTALSDDNPVTVNGAATFDKATWSAQLNAKGQGLTVQHHTIKKAVVSPDLAISITPQQTVVTGDITLENASIEIPKLENTGVPLSDDIVIIDAADKPEYLPNTLSNHTVLADINVDLGEHVYFQGYGLNAELSGGATIKLEPQRTPELLGVVNVQNGTYRSYGQSLLIREGRISFVGPIEQTALSVEAVRNTGNVLAGIRIEGSLNNPQTTLFSDPPMPEEHILPYVVLGRPLEFSNSTDDSQLIANAALFMGISNGRSLTRGIAANLGIKDFTMNATGSGEDTQVLLSGRLNDRLLVRYGLGVFNSVNTLFLRYDLAEKLYLETTQGLEKAVDVFYSFEFD